MIICKSDDQIKLMAKAGRIVSEVLLKIEEALEPGIKTMDLDRLAEKIITGNGAIPAFKGYKGRISARPYPGSICASVNEEVVHGIPGKREIKEGDLVSIDVGVQLGDYFADAARSFIIGKADESLKRLYKATKDALELSIDKTRIGNRLSDLSSAIEKRALKDGFSVVKDFVGHGIGTKMHEDPQILNYGPPGRGPVLKKGMVFAIEPMLNEGTSSVEVLKDMWTVVTKDRKRSCHFEDSVAITEGGPLILTR